MRNHFFALLDESQNLSETEKKKLKNILTHALRMQVIIFL